ncbi:carboxymuconolactone decarboxylase family protein [Frankia sp. AgPm24]|uniref:carboxymuconolactone decarboxylase family protein n=1 Tax=Frankia TaxID=1854 RepID=UPI0013D1F843|nr:MULTISPECIES: carboxymuconolactone decarboxylase family protein [Frankia]MCK9921714.1 carboxymuconolactone decarboxylase family protein [Frankia sp. AgPm24]
MAARMKNPAAVIAEAWPAIAALNAASESADVPLVTLALVHLRVSQVNGCSACVDAGVRDALKAGETPERLGAVVAWRDTTYFNDAERAALALAEGATRLSDRTDPVPDDVWNEAVRHYDDRGMASLLLKIATTNVFNRLNAITKQTAGAGAW